MSRVMKVFLCLSLSFMFLFLTVGYSAITGNLNIKGTAKYEVPSGLFITNIKTMGTSGLDKNNVSYIKYSTTVDSTLSKSSNGTAGSATYEITVYNNTNLTYAYRGLYFQSSLAGYNNGYVKTSNSSTAIGVITDFPNGRTVQPNEYLTFRVTYTLGSSRNTFPSRNDYKTLLNYQFGINVDSEEQAKEAIYEKFFDILNTTSTYQTLVDVLDNKFDGSQEWTSNYVGNVGDADTDDAVAVNTLFAGQLQMIINGQVKNASVLIKHENLDNNTKTGDDYVAINSSNGGSFYGYGCEMTLYLTVDELDTPYGSAPVYVTVFTCNRDDNGNIVGDWYRIGDTYSGSAPIVGYNGASGGTGSFVTDNWVADSMQYSDNYYKYNVAGGTTIKDLVRVIDPGATMAFQELLDDAKLIIDDLTYAGTAITIVEDAYAAASEFYTLDDMGNPIADENATRARLIPIMNDLHYAIEKAREEIDKINGGN